MNSFELMGKKSLEDVNGGGLAGAFVGFIFGTAGGAVAGCISASISGNSEDAGHIIWQTTKKGMTGGAIAGLLSPM